MSTSSSTTVNMGNLESRTIESDTDQARRLQQEAADQLAREQRATIAERAAQPLIGRVGDLGQRHLFGQVELF